MENMLDDNYVKGLVNRINLYTDGNISVSNKDNRVLVVYKINDSEFSAYFDNTWNLVSALSLVIKVVTKGADW